MNLVSTPLSNDSASATATAEPPELTEEAALWAAWRNAGENARDEIDALVNFYTPLVKAEAGRLAYQIPRHVDRQELIADGLVGLFSAITHFDPAQGVEFVIYARRRVTGAMLDRVRSLDGIPRSTRKATRRITKAMQGFTSREGRTPDENELAKEVGVEVDALHELERQAGFARSISLEAENGNSDTGHSYRDGVTANDRGGLEEITLQESKQKLVGALEALPDRERAICVLYYQQGLMLKEIAAAMEISEGRVSQLHTRALLRLRAFMGGETDEPIEDE